MNQITRQPQTRLVALEDQNSYIGEFQAMGADCQVLMSGCNLRQANQCLEMVSVEAWRIQNKFSRFSRDSVTAQINQSSGRPVEVDRETDYLLDRAEQLYQLSNGHFDATAGCLREIWHFTPAGRPPRSQQVDSMLEHIGWHQLRRSPNEIMLPENVQLDFDAVARSYAVDSCLKLTRHEASATLVNLGGDVAANAPQVDGNPWKVAISGIGNGFDQVQHILLEKGGVATRGDSKRYIQLDGVKYGHVLDAHNGWPLANAPASVTAVGASCEEASMYSTTALYNTSEAEQFLKGNSIRYWIQSSN